MRRIGKQEEATHQIRDVDSFASDRWPDKKNLLQKSASKSTEHTFHVREIHRGRRLTELCTGTSTFIATGKVFS